MNRARVEDDDPDDADSFDTDAEADVDADVVTIPCPWCRKAIWEESVACEHCGRYLSEEDQPRRRPWWLILGVLAGLACVYFWIRR